jgi:hypothetical protein
MKNVKIPKPKGLSEAVNLRRTDNTITNLKITTGQTTVYKTYIEN